jgi:hypothetical protein
MPHPVQDREQRLLNMVAFTLADPANGIDGEPGTEGHADPGEPWSAPVMVLAGLARPVDCSGPEVPWLYLACRCGWWLGYGPQHDPAEFARIAAVHSVRCELNPQPQDPSAGSACTLTWVQPRPGMHVAAGRRGVHLIIERGRGITLTRYGSRPGDGQLPAGGFAVATEAALNALTIDGAFEVVPEAAAAVIARLKKTAQDYEDGRVPATSNPAWWPARAEEEN